MGGERGMFDVLVRMMDEQGEDILPSEFMSAAERNDLMTNIDRGNQRIFGRLRQPANQRLFVRLSKDSVRDKSLPAWLNLQLKSTPSIQFSLLSSHRRICHGYLSEAGALGSELRQICFKYAVGTLPRRDPWFIGACAGRLFKVDGSLMQRLAVDTEYNNASKH